MNGPIFKNTPEAMIPPLTDYSQQRLKTRVICFFYGKEDFKDEIKELKQAARNLIERSNLRIGIVTDTKLIKRLHK